MKRVVVIFLIMVFAGSFAVSEVLIPGWWDANLDELMRTRESLDAALKGIGMPDNTIHLVGNWRTESNEALNNALMQIDSQIIAMGGSIGTPVPTWTPAPTWTPVPAWSPMPTQVPANNGINTPRKNGSGKSKAQVIQELGNDFRQETDGQFEYLIFQRQQFGFEWDMLYRFLDDDLSKVSYMLLNNDVKSMLTDFDNLCVQLEKIYGPNEILGRTTEEEVETLIKANLGKSKLLISARYKGNNNTFVLLLAYYHRNKIITSLEYRKERYDYNNNGLDVFLRKFGEELVTQGTDNTSSLVEKKPEEVPDINSYITKEPLDTSSVGSNNEMNNSVSYGTVNATKVNIRRKPDKGSDIIAKLDRGTGVEIIGQTENARGETWYNIKMKNGKEGYIVQEYLSLGNVEKENSGSSDAEIEKFMKDQRSKKGDVTAQFFLHVLPQLHHNTIELYNRNDECKSWIAASIIRETLVTESEYTESKDIINVINQAIALNNIFITITDHHGENWINNGTKQLVQVFVFGDKYWGSIVTSIVDTLESANSRWYISFDSYISMTNEKDKNLAANTFMKYFSKEGKFTYYHVDSKKVLDLKEYSNPGDIANAVIKQIERLENEEKYNTVTTISEDAKYRYFDDDYCVTIGDYYYDSGNYKEALECYLSIRSKAPEAENRIGYMYLYGEGTKISYEDAMEWFLIAAEHSNSDAMTSIGYMYENGYGVKQNYATAMEWYKRAAELNHPMALNNIGNSYGLGLGVSRDYTKAIEYFQKAIEFGSDYAMDNLGCLYVDGKGVSRDYKKAKELFEKAAEMGNKSAMFHLSRLLNEGGHGLKKDTEAAKIRYQKYLE